MEPNSRITDLFHSGQALLSVEFFPPKTEEGGRQILETAQALAGQLRPDYVSITYGAGGGTRERTLRYARLLKDECGFHVMPHLTCVGSSRQELRDIITGYYDEGFRNIMALRGDPPRGQPDFRPHPDGCRYANELVELALDVAPGLCLGVAGYPETHPEAPSPEADLLNLRRKVDAGASFVTTQLFYDNTQYFAFAARCKEIGIRVPVIPGIMPALNAEQARRFARSVPAELVARLLAAPDAAAAEAVGLDWAAEQVAGLLAAGVPGVHLYLLNRRDSALALATRLQSRGALQAPKGLVGESEKLKAII